jgi:hypothetical protein
MRKSVVLIGLSILILAFGFVMFSGCAKKVVKEAEEEKTTTVQKEAAPAAPAAPAETEENRGFAREKALREGGPSRSTGKGKNARRAEGQRGSDLAPRQSPKFRIFILISTNMT